MHHLALLHLFGNVLLYVYLPYLCASTSTVLYFFISLSILILLDLLVWDKLVSAAPGLIEQDQVSSFYTYRILRRRVTDQRPRSPSTRQP